MSSRRSSRGASQHSVEQMNEQMRRSMSLASQQEVPTYEEDERNANSYASHHSGGDMGGGGVRRASEAPQSSARYDRSNNVRKEVAIIITYFRVTVARAHYWRDYNCVCACGYIATD